MFGAPRFFAIVLASDGDDLADLLVRHGLACIGVMRTRLPDGRTSCQYRARLQELENDPKAAKRGSWELP